MICLSSGSPSAESLDAKKPCWATMEKSSAMPPWRKPWKGERNVEKSLWVGITKTCSALSIAILVRKFPAGMHSGGNRTTERPETEGGLTEEVAGGEGAWTGILAIKKFIGAALCGQPQTAILLFTN